jgi:VCBS repeat-containing protein
MTNENTILFRDVLANDRDPDRGDVLTITAVNNDAANVGRLITLSSGALLTVERDGSIQYDPNGQFEFLAEGETTTDGFIYTVDDGKGGSATAAVTLRIVGRDDSSLPNISIAGNSVTEGNSGVQQLKFTVSLSEASSQPITVNYATGNDSQGAFAVAGEDYKSTNGTLTFLPGDTSLPIFVAVYGDTNRESTEFLYVKLSNPTNAEISSDGQRLNDEADGIIINDDGAPRKTSHGWGDPHLVTFDGVSYDFQAVGEFIFAESKTDNWEIQVRQQPWRNNNAVSVNTAVATLVDGTDVELYVGQAQPLAVDGVFTAIADGSSLTVGDSQILRNGNTYTVIYAGDDGILTAEDDRLIATVNGDHINLSVLLSNQREGSIQGLWGNGDGLTANDFALRDGTVIAQPLAFGQLYGTYADSWRVSQDESLFHYAPGTDTNTFTNRNFPGQPISVNDLDPVVRVAAEQVVRDAGIPEGPAFNAAVLDYALTNDVTFVAGAAAVLNKAPVAEGDIFTVAEGETLNIAAPGVLANDSDADGNSLAATLVGSPVNGTLSLNGDGSFTYVHNGSETTTDSFTYQVSDGVNSTLGIVNLTVTPINDAPLAQSDAFATDEDTALTGNVLTDNGSGADSDPDGDPLTVTAVNGAAADVGTQITLASGALLTLNANGIFDYNPNGQFESLNAGQTATDSFTYTVDDGQGGSATATVTVTIDGVNDVPTLAISAGPDISLDEGETFIRTITFTDGDDTGSDGWTYVIDWDNDGTVDETGTISAGNNSFDISRTYPDGPASETVSITVIDEPGVDEDTASFEVTVNNVASTAAVSGADTVDEGSPYTLTVGAVADPGADTRTGYSIDWGDGGTTKSFTPTGWANAAGVFTHTYADGGNGGTARTITVSTTDEDDSFTLGTKNLTVNDVAPAILLAGAASVAEGSTYTLTLGAVSDPGTDTVTQYMVHWGDGTTDTYAAGGDVTHVYADDQDGPINATPRAISVDLVNEDGTFSDVATHDVSVTNVAPTIALAGANSVDAGTAYTLTLGAITDPGQDTVTTYLVDWGDGSTNTHGAGGNVTHTYATAGNYNIGVDLTDEDGTFVDAGTMAVTVNQVAEPEIVKIGDAPARLTSANPNAWVEAWSHEHITITHKVNVENANESWTPVTLQNGSPLTLAGSDVYLGDLGVSGQTAATSAVRQEIDGTEGLRFDLSHDASRATLDLSRFYLQDDGLTFAEAGRVQAFDQNGNLVAEQSFVASSTTGNQEITLEAAGGFHSLVVTAGVYHGADFVEGGYATAAGAFGSDSVLSDGKLHGSDFLIDAVEFEFLPADVVGNNGLFGHGDGF